MPQKHQDTKIHKTNIIKLISLVRFGDLVIWWQNNYFSEGTQSLKPLKIRMSSRTKREICYMDKN